MKYNKSEIIDFKLLLLKAVGFFLIFITINYSLGYISKIAFFSQKTGKFARVTYSIYENYSDVLIMGSSHANRHYVPEIFEKELNLTVYNAGVQGQHLIFQTALQKMILKRYKPKLIILNIDENWMYESNEAYERLSDLHPYYWDFENEIDSILSLHSKFNKFKLLFSAYQTNSTFVHIVKYYFQPQEDYKGYRPLYNSMVKPLNNYEIDNGNEKPQLIDNNFLIIFDELIKNAKSNNIDLVFVISPLINYSPILKKSKSLEMMKLKAFENDIRLLDFSNDSSFIEKYNLFSDANHLNNDGANLFSKAVSDSLKKNNAK